MNLHWHDEDGAYCEQHAPLVEDLDYEEAWKAKYGHTKRMFKPRLVKEEGDANSNETDTPDNCQVCGRPCEYTLTQAGVAYVLDAILEELADCSDWKLRFGWHLSYYKGSPSYACVLDWAKDLKSYGLERWQRKILQTFLTAVERFERKRQRRRGRS